MIEPFFHFEPRVPTSAYVHPQAHVSGRVFLGDNSSIWPGAVLRGDVNEIRIGDGSNIQDNSVLHVTDDLALTVGRDVVVGHAVKLHGCTIGDGCLIGIGSLVLDGAVVGEGSIIAAGSIVTERSVLEPRGLYMGAPARLRRVVSEEEMARIVGLARKYTLLARAWHVQELARRQGGRLGEREWADALESLNRRV